MLFSCHARMFLLGRSVTLRRFVFPFFFFLNQTFKTLMFSNNNFGQTKPVAFRQSNLSQRDIRPEEGRCVLSLAINRCRIGCYDILIQQLVSIQSSQLKRELEKNNTTSCYSYESSDFEISAPLNSAFKDGSSWILRFELRLFPLEIFLKMNGVWSFRLEFLFKLSEVFVLSIHVYWVCNQICILLLLPCYRNCSMTCHLRKK